MDGTHQITLTIGKEGRKWYQGFDPVTGEKLSGVDYIAYPKISESNFFRLLHGTPEDVQYILSTVVNL